MPLAPAIKAVLAITNPSAPPLRRQPALGDTPRPTTHQRPPGSVARSRTQILPIGKKPVSRCKPTIFFKRQQKSCNDGAARPSTPAEAGDPLQTDFQASPRPQILRYFACTRRRRLGRTPSAALTAARRSCRSARSTAPPSPETRTPPRLPAQRRRYGECDAHVHRAAHRQPDHRVRPTPAQPAPCLPSRRPVAVLDVLTSELPRPITPQPASAVDAARIGR